MGWGEYLFSFEGRVNRARYWKFVGVAVAWVLVTEVVAMLSGLAATGGHGTATGGAGFVIVIVVVIAAIASFLAMLVASLAVSVKRLHDRNKSGWWLLLLIVLPELLAGFSRLESSPFASPAAKLVSGLAALVSLPFSIWAFVELGCLRGTAGSNRFGPDALGGVGEHVVEIFS